MSASSRFLPSWFLRGVRLSAPQLSLSIRNQIHVSLPGLRSCSRPLSTVQIPLQSVDVRAWSPLTLNNWLVESVEFLSGLLHCCCEAFERADRGKPALLLPYSASLTKEHPVSSTRPIAKSSLAPHLRATLERLGLLGVESGASVTACDRDLLV